MSKENFLRLEADEVNKLYAEIMFALNEVKDFVPKNKLKSRRCVKYLPVLEQYKHLVEAEISSATRKGTFEKLFGSNKSIELIENYKDENIKAFNESKNCMNCKCFKCVKDCRMEGCNRCEEGVGCKITSCDNETTAVYILRNKYLELNDDKTDEINTYKVLGIVQDLQYTTFYIIMELNGNKLVYYYYPRIDGDEFGEITDVEDFNFAIESFEDAE